MIKLKPSLAMIFAVSLCHCSNDPAQSGTPLADAALHDEADAPPRTSPDAVADALAPSPPDASDARADALDATPDAFDAKADARDALGGADASSPDARSDAETMDGAVCAAGERLLYASPGCGAAAPVPRCFGQIDACVTPVCDCAGNTVGSACGLHDDPFRSHGACPDANADIDASSGE